MPLYKEDSNNGQDFFMWRVNRSFYHDFILASIVLLGMPACAQFNQHPINTYTENTHGSELTYLGRDPENEDRSLIRIRGIELTVFGTVPAPSLDSLHLLNHTHIKAGETMLDMGTGTGVQAIFAAKKNARVVAIDINPQAVENARLNIKRHQFQNRIDVRVGDLFAPLADNETFDVIVLNLKYPQGDADQALWQVHERFFSEVNKYLKPGGRIYYQFGYLRNQTHVEEMLERNNLYIAEKRLGRSTNEGGGLFITFEIRPQQKTTAPK